MVFSSHIFLFYFLPLTLALYYILPHRLRTGMLVLVSYLFYGWSNPFWVLLMFLNTMVDYVCGLALIKYSGLPYSTDPLPLLPKDQPRNRKQTAALVVSISCNLTLLAYFKYYDFGVSNINALASSLGWGDN